MFRVLCLGWDLDSIVRFLEGWLETGRERFDPDPSAEDEQMNDDTRMFPGAVQRAISKKGFAYVLAPIGHPRANHFGFIAEHLLVAERALGRPIPIKHPVYHIDRNRANNNSSNLVICEDRVYHKLIKGRGIAFMACGHGNWRKCPWCKSWDDPAELVEYGEFAYHRRCLDSLREKARLSARKTYKNLSPEAYERRLRWTREHWERRPKGEQAEYMRNWRAARKATMTPRQIEAELEKDRERSRRYHRKMTIEQRQAKRLRDRERRNNWTPEQRAAKLSQQRERDRRRRECKAQK